MEKNVRENQNVKDGRISDLQKKIAIKIIKEHKLFKSLPYLIIFYGIIFLILDLLLMTRGVELIYFPAYIFAGIAIVISTITMVVRIRFFLIIDEEQIKLIKFQSRKEQLKNRDLNGTRYFMSRIAAYINNFYESIESNIKVHLKNMDNSQKLPDPKFKAIIKILTLNLIMNSMMGVAAIVLFVLIFIFEPPVIQLARFYIPFIALFISSIIILIISLNIKRYSKKWMMLYNDLKNWEKKVEELSLNSNSNEDSNYTDLNVN